MKREHYMTGHKKRVLDFLAAHKDRHFSMDEIALGLNESGLSVPKSTVYRQVNRLFSEGIVRRFETKDKKCFVYQYASGGDDCDRHFHFKCVDCGRLLHMDCPELDAVRHHIMESHDFVIGVGRSVLYGECKQCVEGKKQV